MLPSSLRRAIPVAVLLVALAPLAFAAGEHVIAWNNLGMHCMDSDFSLFSILPPYNTIYAQVVDGSGNLVTDPGGFTVTYQAVADPSGSLNTTSVGKTNFWDYVQTLFGATLSPDQGLAGFAMPGSANQPQPMTWDAAQRWFMAEGIPITPYDDQGFKNPYPMMRVTLKNGTGQVLATTDIVLPVSDEMDCRACHASGSSPAAEPSAGWVYDPNPDLDYRSNILRLHDERHLGKAAFGDSLVAAGYTTGGLEATAASGTTVLCASCHASNALPGTGVPGLPPLTRAVHGWHAHVTDPTNGQSLDASTNRSACYRCHPGSTTRCLRGAMGAAVASDGSLAMQCQSCHGSMSEVGGEREGWLDEPGCGSCHTGTATANSGEIRYTSVFDIPGHERVPANRTFATNLDVPAAGYSLFRFSYGHGGLACSACHGATHAEYPSTHDGDNVQSVDLQGHEGMLADCRTCHGSSPSTVTGGPHGMHPVGQEWVQAHPDAAEGGATACQACHGEDYRGTVLSRALGDRSVSAFGSTKTLWRGYQIGCYLCHNGPSSDDGTSNHPPTAANRSATTAHDTPVSIALSASDADGDPLTLRIVSQPQHGTVGLSSSTANYIPGAGFGGSDTFTYAAWDGSASSNLATVTVTVTPAQLTLGDINMWTATDAPLTAHFSAQVSGGVEPYVHDWDFGDGSAHSPLPGPSHTYASEGSYTVTLAVTDGAAGSVSTTSTVTVGSGASSNRYLIPGVAHNPGAAGTLWRSDVAAVNLEATEATVTLTFRSPSETLSATATVPAGGAVEWLNVVEEVLGATPDADLSGSLELASDQPLFVTARTFNQTADGTYGQSLPALTAADALTAGDVGVLPQLRKSVDFRTNIGAVNLGASNTTLRIRLFGATGDQVGSDLSLSVPPDKWRQINDVFIVSGAGNQEVAFATVEVIGGEAVWAYGSLIDARTGDPTTIAVMKR